MREEMEDSGQYNFLEGYDNLGAFSDIYMLKFSVVCSSFWLFIEYDCINCPSQA